ncbi:MAG: type II toxin-antitoxin system VapC family toxin [Chthoniobacterales bacterium]
MIAIDSSPLIAIFKGEAFGAKWLELLLRLRTEDQLAACDVVWAEVGSVFPTLEMLRSSMDEFGIHFAPLDEIACFRAGQLFCDYRRRGGARTRMVADFMIAAHALEHATGLATADDDFVRTHFPRLRIVKP